MGEEFWPPPHLPEEERKNSTRSAAEASDEERCSKPHFAARVGRLSRTPCAVNLFHIAASSWTPDAVLVSILRVQPATDRFSVTTLICFRLHSA